MRTFKDTTGDEWTVSVAWGDIVRVEKETGVNLPDLFDKDMELLARVSSDFGLLVSVVACLCSDQIDSRGLNETEFAGRFGGDVLEDSFEAVLQATIDFFPSERRREALREWLAKIQKASTTILETATPQLMERMDKAIAELSSSDLEKLLDGRSTSSPG